MTGNRARSRQAPRSQPAAALSPLRPFPTHGAKVAHPDEYARLCPIRLNRCAKIESKQLYLVHRHKEAAKIRRQRNMTQMQEKNRTPEKELRDVEIADLSDAEFKTLVVRMLKDLAEYGRSNIGKK